MEARLQLLSTSEARFRVILVVLGLGLFSVMVIGLFSLATSPLEVVSLILAYTSAPVRALGGHGAPRGGSDSLGRISPAPGRHEGSDPCGTAHFLEQIPITNLQ
jgi:hypothetical protein